MRNEANGGAPVGRGGVGSTQGRALNAECALRKVLATLPLGGDQRRIPR